MLRVAPDGRHHHAEVRPEVDRQPAVGVDRLPVARAPRVVAQPQAVDLHGLAVDLDRAVHLHVLLVVRLRELLLRIDDLVTRAGGAVRRPRRLVDKVDLHLLPRVVLERHARVRHLRRILQVHRAALVHRAELLQRLDHLEAHAAGVHRVVVLDHRAIVLEQHAAVGQVERQRHLGAALVRAVAQPHEAAALARAVEEVEVHALVEVRLGPQRVGVVVLPRDVTENRDHVSPRIRTARPNRAG